uniref:Uncharacterized protein n=1 Tax=Rhizophora mucronata TaxID=61149 RepID=A0A2P2PHA5_RHIMU
MQSDIVLLQTSSLTNNPLFLSIYTKTDGEREIISNWSCR